MSAPKTERTWSHAEVMRYAAETLDLFVEYREGRGHETQRARTMALSELDGALDYDASVPGPEVRQ